MHWHQADGQCSHGSLYYTVNWRCVFPLLSVLPAGSSFVIAGDHNADPLGECWQSQLTAGGLSWVCFLEPYRMLLLGMWTQLHAPHTGAGA